MKYKLSKLVIGLAAVCAFSGQASAGSYNLSFTPDIYGNYFADFGSFTDGTASAGGGQLTPTNLSDAFSFTLSSIQAGPVTNLNVTASFVAAGPQPLLQFTLTDITTSTQVESVFGSGNLSISDTPTLNSKDSYSLLVTDLTPTVPATYNGNITISPVPEPTEGALLLSGLGLMGFIAARRNRKEA